MICKHCGKELEDGGTYCCYCGNRADGKVICQSCGASMTFDALFCSACGKPLQDKKPVSGGGYGEMAITDAVENGFVAPCGRNTVAGWKKITEYVCCGLIACAALFGFIFSFIIGVQAEYAGVGATVDIYHYFGGVYNQISEAIGKGSLTDAVLTTYYFPAATGTLIAAASIILAIVFGSLTISAAVKKFAYKKENVNFYKPAVLTYLSFAMCATAFLAMHAMSASSSGTAVSAEFSGATLAGLVVGGIMFGGFTLCRIAVRFADIIVKKENCATIIISVVATVLSVVVVAVLAMPSINIFYNGNSASAGYIEFMELLRGWKNVNTAIACSAVGFALQITMIALTFKMLFSFTWYATAGQSGAILGAAIANLVLSGANIAMAYVSANAFVDVAYEQSSYSYTCSFGAPVALTVVSAVLLVAVILFKIYRDKTANNAIVETEYIAE